MSLKKICSGSNGCGKVKLLDEFVKSKNSPTGYRNTCKECKSQSDKKYREKNKDKLVVQKKKYAEKNKDKIKKYKQGYYIKNKKTESLKKKANYNKNKETILKNQKEYYKLNKKEINRKKRERKKDKLNNDLSYKLRENISKAVRRAIKLQGEQKKGSVWAVLPYTPLDLINHLRSQMVGPNAWMNFNNYGPLNLEKWDDNDNTTWTWQIDHIIPHSEFKYSSIKSDEFRECWDLSNLRPYPAKQNLLDGVNRTRHKVK